MSEWIKREADRIKEQDRLESEKRRWELHKRDVLATRWREAWSPIAAAIREHVATFNAQFPSAQNRHLQLDEHAHGLTIERPGSLTRVVHINPTADGVRVRRIETEMETMRQSTSEEPAIPFNLTSEGLLGLASNGGVATPDTAAERILRALF